MKTFLLCLGWVGTLLLVVTPARAQTPTPDPATLLSDCAAILPAERPQPTGADAPTIRIVAPASGTTIRSSAEQFAEVSLTVRLSNFSLGGAGADENTRHWHLWLNNSVWGMGYQETIVTGIPFGRWRVCASLGDSDHIDLGQPDGIYLIVERSVPGEIDAVIPPGTGMNTDREDDAADGGQAALIVLLGCVAAVAGWWLGRRRLTLPIEVHPVDRRDGL